MERILEIITADVPELLEQVNGFLLAEGVDERIVILF
jgi:hypothetical protein